jgi:hypothetical protein
MATVFVYGTFGSGTLKLQASPDGGTTKIDLPNLSGTAISVTANGIYNIQLGNGNALGADIILYAVLTGATNPSLTVAIYDNR